MIDVIPGGAPAPAAPTAAPDVAPASQPEPSPSAADREAEALAAHDKAMDEIWEKHQGADDEDDKKTTPERGPDGKFKAKLPPAPIDPNSPAPQTAKPAAPLKEDGQPNPSDPPAAPAAEAPKWWPSELQAKFKTLPPDIAKAIGDQALSERQTISKLGNALQSFEPIGRVIQQYKADFDQVGISPAEGIHQLLAVQQALVNPQTRAAVYRDLLQRYPVDLSQFGVDPFGLPPDPQVEAQNNRIAALERELSGFRANAQQAQQAQAQQRLQASYSVVDQIAAKLPHFDEVAQDVLMLLPGIRAQNPSLSDADALTAAHERAVWANAKTRALMQEAEIKKQQQAALEAAKAAERANAINIRSKQPSRTALTERELDEQIWNKHHAA